MLETLHHPKRSIRKEVSWVMSNLTAGTNDQLQACIDGGLIDQLSQILLHDDATVKMEAVWALVLDERLRKWLDSLAQDF